MLEQATSSLNQKRAECRALQSELDETITFVFDLLAEEARRRAGGPTTSHQDRADSAAGKLKSESETLRNELCKAEFLEQEQAKQLEELKVALLEAEAEIRATQTEAEQEIATLMEERQSFESAASRGRNRRARRSGWARISRIADADLFAPLTDADLFAPLTGRP